MTDCQQVTIELHQYLDRELTRDEACEVEAHLARCPSCYELERFESGVTQLVRRDCGADRAPAHLRDRLLSMPRT